MNSNDNFYQSGEFYTNNPDDELIDNNNKMNDMNNKEEESNNKKKDKLFFDDDIGIETKKVNDNPFLSQNEEILENNNYDNNNKEEQNNFNNNKQIENEKNNKNEIIIEENKIEEKKEKKKKKKKKEIQIEKIQENPNEEEGLKNLLEGPKNNEDEDININPRPNIKKLILAILFGQLLSLLSVGNGYFVEEIQKQKELQIPLLLNSTYYLILFFIYFFISKLKVKKPKLIYIILSICDTQANYINIFIFSKIEFKYPYIINILSNIWTVLFTLILLRQYKYLINHKIGLILCFVGVFSAFLGSFNDIDKFVSMFSSFNDDILGILLCLLVSLLYGLNAVLIEKFISEENDEIKSYCTWLGIFGFAISIIESLIPISDDGFEFQILFDTKAHMVDIVVIIFWILSSICLAAMTSLSPFYIQKFGATMFNISLVFTVLWAYIIDSIFINKKYEFYWLNIFYFIGFIIIIIGTVIFMRKERIKRNEYNYA